MPALALTPFVAQPCIVAPRSEFVENAVAVPLGTYGTERESSDHYQPEKEVYHA